MSDSIGLLQLCNELRTEICSYLPIADRKNVRLVCKSLYIACQCFLITRNEKFIIRPCFMNEEIYRTLVACQYDKMNLYFRRIRVHELQPSLFTTIGDKIIFISLFRCSLTVESIKNIFEHCNNLQHFELHMRYEDKSGLILPRKIDVEYDIWLIAVALNELTEENIKKRNLIAFEIYCCSTGHKLCNEVIEKAFTIFPNLKTFRYGASLQSANRDGLYNFHRQYSPDDSSSSENEADDSFDFFDEALFFEIASKFLQNRSRKCDIRVDQYLESSKVENFMFRACDHFDWFEKISALKNKKFKKIHVKIEIYPWEHETLDNFIKVPYDFFSKQTELEELNFTFGLIGDLTLQHILESCPQLRRLSLDNGHSCTELVSENQFLMILNSNLEYLHVRSIAVKNLHNTFRLPFNERLQTLILDQTYGREHEISYESFAIILKHFRRLTHLTLSSITNKELQLIFRYHPNLVFLSVSPKFGKKFSSYGFVGKRNNSKNSFATPTYSIRNMTKLKYFLINDAHGITDEQLILDEGAIANFDLPQLKRFAIRISSNNKCLVNLVTSVISKSPLLEVLEVNCTFYRQQLFNVLKSAKNLRQMTCANRISIVPHPYEYYTISEKMLRKLFASCKSLRSLSDYSGVVYYNPFTFTIYEMEDEDWLDSFSCVEQ